jgi:hypothetical protein
VTKVEALAEAALERLAWRGPDEAVAVLSEEEFAKLQRDHFIYAEYMNEDRPKLATILRAGNRRWGETHLALKQERCVSWVAELGA